MVTRCDLLMYSTTLGYSSSCPTPSKSEGAPGQTVGAAGGWVWGGFRSAAWPRRPPLVSYGGAAGGVRAVTRLVLVDLQRCTPFSSRWPGSSSTKTEH